MKDPDGTLEPDPEPDPEPESEPELTVAVDTPCSTFLPLWEGLRNITGPTVRLSRRMEETSITARVEARAHRAEPSGSHTSGPMNGLPWYTPAPVPAAAADFEEVRPSEDKDTENDASRCSKDNSRSADDKDKE